MKSQKTKLMILAGAAVILIAGIVALNRPASRETGRTNKGVERDVASSKSSRSRLSAGSGGDSSSSDASKTSGTKEKDPLYGLPPLTLENADINPEKPADMPLADWEEYERQRYDLVQLKAYKFRETDPSKVVAHEIAKVVPDAAKKYEIPEELLAALLYTSSDGGHHGAEHDTEGGFGLMMLKESPQCDSLGEAAELLNVSREDLIYNQQLNVMGGAAVLRQYYDDAVASGLSESEAWYMAVAQYSGRPQPELAAALADQVAGNMIRGYEIDSDDGSGYYKQDPLGNPIFQPKNWKLAAVDPPPSATQENQASNNNGNQGAVSQ